MKTLEDKLDLTLRDFASSYPRVTESEDIWGPLHKVVPKKWQDGFMFLDKTDGYIITTSQGQRVRVTIYDYKHGVTRKTLHISKSGQCYCNTRNTIEGIGLEPCSKQRALEIVFQDIEHLGATRETKYNEEYRYHRDKALIEAGFTVIGVSPGKFTKKKKEFEYQEEL